MTIPEADAKPATIAAKQIGRPIERLDGPLKTTGRARYAAEHRYPRLAHAALVYSTISRGRITAIETAAARGVDGVIVVLTHENAPAMTQPPKGMSLLDLTSVVSGTWVNYLATDEVHWNGQPVALVVAETPEAARYAASLVRPSYERLPAIVDFASAARSPAAEKGIPLIAPAAATKGDAPAALAAAPIAVDLSFRTPQHNHNALELHATIASWDGDRLTLHEGSQNIPWLRTHVAKRFGVPEKGVRVLSPFVGGGFGGKALVWAGTLLAALAARAVGRPVRLVLTREGVYHTVGGRAASLQRVALGADEHGRLSSIIHTSSARTARVGGSLEPITGPSRHLYAAPNIQLRQNVVELDLLSPTYMRGPGDALGTFALESAMDELAWKVGIDPIELRMLNEPKRDPVGGQRFTHRKLRELYALGAERFGWRARDPKAGATRDGRWLVGMGVATAYLPSSYLPASVTVRVLADGTVVVRCGIHEIGVGAITVQTQIAADEMGVPLDCVRVEHGDSDLPPSAPAVGSAQTAGVAAGVLAACHRLKKSALAHAQRTSNSPLKGWKLQDLRARDGGLFHPGGGQTWPEILAAAGRDHLEAAYRGRLTGYMRRMVLDGRRWFTAASGAQFCEVRVDAETGEIRVSRWLGVFDIGTVINPRTAASQLRGGIVMGIGMALSEETLIDPRSGRIMNPSLAEYHVPVHADIPRIDVQFLGDPDPSMPLGLLAAGELGITGAAAAVANAVRHATGTRVTDLPITLDKVFTAVLER